MIKTLLRGLLISALLVTSLFAQAAPQGNITLGVVYNIFHEEFSSDAQFKAQVDKDISRMAQLNIRQVLIFPLGQWNPDTQQLDWQRTDYLIASIQKAGLQFVPVLFKEQQAGHYFPIWEFNKIPGLVAEHSQDKTWRNGREDVDFADPRLYPYVESYIKAVIERYGDNPALAFYNIWNEPHYAPRGEHALASYRQWLKQRYGDLAALRRAWGEDYTAWEQITPYVNDDWNSSMPWIDWIRFRNENQGALLGKLKATVHKYDKRHAVNANPVGTPWAPPFSDFSLFHTDAWQFTEHNDINGLSYYPDIWERANPGKSTPLWMHNLTLSLFRSASGNKDYILTELYTNAKTGLTLAGYLDKPRMNWISWATFANNAKGVIYWKWEPFKRGRQALGRGLTELNGELAPRGEAVAELASVVKAHGPLLYQAQQQQPQVGILFDIVGLLKNLEESTDKRSQLITYESYAGLFKALDEANITSDILRTDRSISLNQLKAYKILYLPFQIVLRRDLAPLLRDYVKQGGHLVADARFATLDELDFAYDQNPGLLTDLFGAERVTWIASPDFYRISSSNPQWTIAGRYFRETLKPSASAQVIARFADNQAPAVVQQRTGEGLTTLVATNLGASYWADPNSQAQGAIVALAIAAGVTPEAQYQAISGATPSIRVHRAGKTQVIYLLNPSDSSTQGDLLITGKKPKVTSLNGQTPALTAAGSERWNLRVQLPPLGVHVLRLEP
jgi:beta-galactosidase